MFRRILISICCLTYNHEKYITQAIDSFLMQKTDFDFEIVIGEDCSIDSTLEIIKRYQQISDKIKVINGEKNVGVGENLKRTLNACKGEYVAFCEGDDYWIDFHKLQKQYNVLKTDTTVGLVYTEFNQLDESTGKQTVNCFKNKLGIKENSFEDFLINAWFLAPCTWMFRKNLLIDFVNEYPTVLDLALLLKLASCSKVVYLPESTSVYRVLAKSMSHGKNLKQKLEMMKVPHRIQHDFIKMQKLSKDVERKVDLKFLASGSVFWATCLTKDSESRKLYANYKNKISSVRLLILIITSFHLPRVILKFTFNIFLIMANSRLLQEILPTLKKVNIKPENAWN